MKAARKRLNTILKEISKKKATLQRARAARERRQRDADLAPLAPAAMKLMMSSPAAAKAFMPLKAAPGLRMLAQGDSWFDYWIGRDVLYWLEADFDYSIDRIAVAGSTLNDVVYGPVPHNLLGIKQSDAPSRIAELVDRIRQDKPDALLLSAGGNDIAGDEFFSFVNNSRSGLEAVNAEVLEGVISETFKKAYKDLIQTALDAAALDGGKMKVFTHGYDYPWPDGRGVLWIKGAIGPWFDSTLNAKNYPNGSMTQLLLRRSIVAPFVDALNAMLKGFEGQFPGKVFHIDVRKTLLKTNAYRDEWANELHPTNAGFRKIAAAFDAQIRQAMGGGSGAPKGIIGKTPVQVVSKVVKTHGARRSPRKR